MSKLTPMMKQYMGIKREYRDSILFFRLGDFYEMFFEDAKTAARVLDLALTSRNKGGGEKAPMAGVPYHSAENYIAKLINSGYKVAICEQIEDPDEAQGIVDRDVIRVITPGTVIDNEILEEKENNYLAAAVETKRKIGFSFIDVSTGEFFVTEFDLEKKEKLWDEIDRISLKEIIIPEKYMNSKKFKLIKERDNLLVNAPSFKDYEKAYQYLLENFQIKSLSVFGLEEMEAAVLAAAEVLKFVNTTQKRTLDHIDKVDFYNLNQYMVLDSATRRNLELTSTIRDKKRSGSLLDIIDKTITSMGGRLIKKWINQPLINKDNIIKRLDAVKELVNNFMDLQDLIDQLDGIYDLERILTKITYGTANARDLAALRYSLKKLPFLKERLAEFKAQYFIDMNKKFDVLEDISILLQESIIEEPPVTLREGGLFKKGYNEKLDKLQKNCNEGKAWISSLQKTERERTAISSLKVGFNKIFGYYIEVTNANLDKVPDNYTRKQTLSNSERYIIPELKEKEAQVLGAEEKINNLEYDLFVELREKIGKNIKRIKKTAGVIAILDVLSSLANVSIENNYNCPQITEDDIIEIKSGRHPVVEKMVEENYVPNDTAMDSKENRFIMITGPNMSGKSTYMRQVALIVLMAQMGCFVPAKKAKIGLVDRIFTRVGASDDLTTGQSTFMVEMNEVANIINNATDKSLVILDEVGRGTSTYDGLSIAWAVSEYINDPKFIGARTLFATHYHELTRLEEKDSGIKNYNVLVEEDQDGVHFLHRIVPGYASDSYGIEVARLAGLPDVLINNAGTILKQLEKIDNEITENEKRNKKDIEKDNKNLDEQLSLFDKKSPVIEKLLSQDLMNMTPMEAMNFLYKLQQKARKV